MIMKANKQIGFIYKNEESIDRVLKDGEVVFERGFLRERTSTTLPITFGGVGKNLKDYKVYGNTYQNITSGKNKFDINQNVTFISTRISCNVVNDDIVLTALSDYDGNAYCTKPIPNSSSLLGQTITLSGNMQRSSQGTFRIILGFLNNTGGYVSDLGSSTAITSDGQHATFDLPSNFPTGATQIGIMLYFSRVGDTIHQGDTVTYSNIQLEIGSNKTSYEPYTGGQPSPNPDYPQEILSCGDKTKNLFLAPDTPSQLNIPTYSKNNKNSFTLYYNQTTTSVKSPYVRIDFDITQFKPNTRYTISKKYTVSGDNFRNVGAIRSYINGSNGSVVNSDTFSFTTPNEISSLGVYFYLGYENRTVGESQITFYDIQIEENSSATPYEPYGYKIPVNVRSDNLLNTLNIPETTVGTVTYKSENGLITINGVSFNRSIELKTGLNKPLNGQYTVIFKKISGNIINNSGVINHRFSLGNVENPSAGSTVGRLLSDLFNSTTDVVVATGTINDVLDKISIYINPNCTFDNYTFQLYLVKGTYTTSNLPEYQPYYNQTTNIYLDEPLRKIGNYSDYIDFKNGKVVRNISEIVLDGSEDWYTSSGTSQVAFNKGVGYIHDTTKLPCNISNNCQMPNNNLYFYSTGYSLADWKTFLSTTNAIVYGRLSTPTEEDIELPNIPTVDGNNTLNIETEITPSQVYIKYKSNE